MSVAPTSRMRGYLAITQNLTGKSFLSVMGLYTYSQVRHDYLGHKVYQNINSKTYVQHMIIS